MLDHVGFEVSDLSRSKAFYEAALEPLGIGLMMEFEGAIGFGKETEHGPKPFFWVHAPTATTSRPSATAPRSPGTIRRIERL
jgi:catechol 2,3-dioxygenase-like lactoylglutathione lyase family enzyme